MELAAGPVDMVGPVPARVAELNAKLAGVLRRSKAPATLRAYRSDWADFCRWCDRLGVVALPADPATVALYIAELADPCDASAPRAVSTISRRLASISAAHKLAGHANPCLDELVKETFKGVRRMLGVAARHAKTGIGTNDIAAVIAGLDERRLIDQRDRALLLVGFAGGFRRSELASLHVTDIEQHPEGLLVSVRRSKTDQEQTGRRVEIVPGRHRATCPVAAYRAWIEQAGIHDGPVFRAVNRHGHISPRALSPQAVALIVKRHIARLGYDPTHFAGHSLRRGHATTAARNGATDRTIMASTGHTNTRTLNAYISDAELFTNPASSYLDL